MKPASLICVVVVLVLTAVAPCQESLLPPPPIVECINNLYQEHGIVLMSSLHEEFSFTYNNTDGCSPAHSDYEFNHNHVTIWGNTAGIVHTHPRDTSPRPSDGDVQTARLAKVPNYVLSAMELWVVLPDGSTHRVAWVQNKHGILQLTIPQEKRKM